MRIPVAFSFALLLLIAPQLTAAERPNILFIAIDDQNDWIGCMQGHPLAKTPAIDGLAARGTLFSNAHCQAPLCNPSRTSLMTGKRPSTTGVYGLAPWFRNVPELKELVTLPHYLKEHGGYTTYSTGKIYHGAYARKKNTTEFDHVGPGASGKPFPEKKLVNTPQPHKLVDWGVFPHRDEDKGDWKVASWAEQQLDQGMQGPFFLSVGFFLPHVPCYATQKWFDLYPTDDSILPPMIANDRDDTPRFSWYLHWKLPEPRLKFLKEADQWHNLCRSYLACVSFVDSQVGRVLEALERNGHADDTIVVLWSDHGWHLGDKEITGKNTLWDRGTRVPLIFAGPGLPEGAVCNQPAELLDIYPTLLDLCDLPPSPALEGISLRPQLTDASTPRERPAITTHNQGNHGIRSERYRYIRYADGSEELYDFESDPNEWRNLASDPAMATVLEDHRKWLPKIDNPAVPGSAHRVLIVDEDGITWEGEPIKPGDPIPEL
ncbi:sulfatase [Calycomorphotria hydatis]|uniref:Choline-sulfatase n=1 Tax=Calycomorphotria hydatis TaxID=2528027 RepID=A0A517T3Q3_9PLAN|nr:sulfatase [Calycomorphotria hydatis]QDT63006.1 Choline-sulfatase [Calycomorphotria hydatis]